MSEIVMTPSDPTVWAKCPKCTQSYLGNVVGKYFAKAYPKRSGKQVLTAEQVVEREKCENCGTDMQFMYEVKY